MTRRRASASSSSTPSSTGRLVRRAPPAPWGGGGPAGAPLPRPTLAGLWGLGGTADEGRAVEVIRSRRLRVPVASGEVGQRPIGLEAGQPVCVPASLFLRHGGPLGR